MPIYEFYCCDCHMVMTFFSRSVDTTSRPACPRCGRKELERQVSAFAPIKHGGMDAEDDIGIDEGRMESAIEALAGQADKIDQDDPRQAAELMRKFTGMTGMKLGGAMEEALSRMENGENPDDIESELGDMMDDEEPLFVEGAKRAGKGDAIRRREPGRDPTLYEM